MKGKLVNRSTMYSATGTFLIRYRINNVCFFFTCLKQSKVFSLKVAIIDIFYINGSFDYDKYLKEALVVANPGNLSPSLALQRLFGSNSSFACLHFTLLVCLTAVINIFIFSKN